jgi:hypothetical protein
VVARDLRDHLDVRVAGEHRIERRSPLFYLSGLGPEAITGGQDEPQRASQALEARTMKCAVRISVNTARVRASR